MDWFNWSRREKNSKSLQVLNTHLWLCWNVELMHAYFNNNKIHNHRAELNYITLKRITLHLFDRKNHVYLVCVYGVDDAGAAPPPRLALLPRREGNEQPNDH
jgi:hypothetical protein